MQQRRELNLKHILKTLRARNARSRGIQRCHARLAGVMHRRLKRERDAMIVEVERAAAAGLQR